MSPLMDSEWRIDELEYEIRKLDQIIFALATGAHVDELDPFGKAHVSWVKAVHQGRGSDPG